MNAAAPRLLPWVFVVTLGGALALFAWQSTQRAARAPYAPPVVTDPEERIAGFCGVGADAAGRGPSYRLAPLYADARRQAFEAAALRERLKLSEGAPWRLERTIERAGADVAGARGSASAHASERVSVRDSVGTALEPIAPPEPAAGVVDPVRALFGAGPGEASAAGTSTWILWGRMPAGAARIVFSPADGGRGTEIALEPCTLKRSEIEVPLARLERAGTRKNEAPNASEVDLEPPVPEQR